MTIGGAARPFPAHLWTEPTFVDLSLEVKWTAAGLYQYADPRTGREQVNLHWLKAQIWPIDDGITQDLIIDHLLQLDQVNYLALYSVAGRDYYQIGDFKRGGSHSGKEFPPPPPEIESRLSSGPAHDFFTEKQWLGREGESASEWEGESERAWEGVSASERVRARRRQPPPRPFCTTHWPLGTSDDCRDCGTARLAHEQSLLERRAMDLDGEN